MLENVKFQFGKGDTYTRDFIIKNYDFDIDNIFLSVKNSANDKRVVLQKTLNNGITLVSDEENEKTYNILIDAIDTDDMKVGFDYFFDIEILTKTSDKDIKITPITGTLTLIDTSTQTYNEGED